MPRPLDHRDNLVPLASMISAFLITATSLLGPEERLGFLGLPLVVVVAVLYIRRSESRPVGPFPALLSIAAITAGALLFNLY